MMKLYVSSFEKSGSTNWGLFYIDAKNRQQLLYEDWNPVVFDREEDAKAKLDAIEKEHDREIEAEPFNLEDAKKYAESHRWKYASTYAKTAPHEYLVKKWLVEDDQKLYERFVATMKIHSVAGFFYGHKNNYLLLGAHYYWFIPTPDNMAVNLINRTTTDYLEYRDGAYYYMPRAEFLVKQRLLCI